MLVRGKYVITHPGQADGIVEDGAVCVQGERIAAVGSYRELARRYPQQDTVGGESFVVMPGLINAHDHGRAPSAFQLGVGDDYVELWLMALLGQRTVDPYLATAFAAIQLIESGVTTVLHSYYDPVLAQNEETLAQTIAAYEQSGLRAVVALGILDQSPVTALCEALLPTLPPALRSQVAEFLSDRPHLDFDDYLAIFRTWRARQEQEQSRITVWPCPVAAHWCSEELLLKLRDEARLARAMMQTHLLETVFQRDQALARRGKTAIAWLEDIGFLGPRLSCAHCVWATEADLDLLAQNGVSVVHNPGSNMRLGSGVAPLRAMLARDINVALGTDGHSLNDDGDMLHEMRLAATLHRAPGRPQACPTAGQALAMATQNGARALGLEEETGVLEADKQADLILLRLDEMQFPFVDPGQDVAHTLLYRGSGRHVDTVIVAGQVLMQRRKHLALDKEGIVDALQQQLPQALGPQGEAWRRLMAQLKPHADRYFGHRAKPARAPYYVFNSKEL